MRYLTSADSQQELLGLKELLTDSGIPALLQTELAPYSKATLFVLIDAQYDDAVQLMNDPMHPVARPVDSDMLARLEAEANSANGVLWASVGKYAVVAVLLVIIAAVFLIGRLS
jgi:hypothetical protein